MVAQPELYMLYIYPTLNCNARCIFCWPAAGFNTALQFPETLTQEEVRRAISDAVDLGLKRIIISGGEPLLKWNLVRVIVEEGLKNGVNVNIETNIIPLSKGIITELVENVKRYRGKLFIGTTILSLNPLLNDKLMGVRGLSERIYNNLRELVRVSSQVEGFRVGAAITVLKSNINEVPRIVEFLLDEIGVGSVKISPVVELGRMSSHGKGDELSMKDLLQLSRVVESLAKKYPFRIASSLPMSLAWSSGPTFCPYEKMMGILPDGRVSVCRDLALEGLRRGLDLFGGNIKTQRLKEIFISSEFFNMIRNLRSKGEFNGACRFCIFKRYCAPGCIAYSFGYYGKLNAPNPMCQRIYEAGVFPHELVEKD